MRTRSDATQAMHVPVVVRATKFILASIARFLAVLAGFMVTPKALFIAF